MGRTFQTTGTPIPPIISPMNFESSAQQPAHGKGVAQKDWIDAKADEGMSQHQQPNAARCIQKQPKTKKFMPEIKGKERLLMKILME